MLPLKDSYQSNCFGVTTLLVSISQYLILRFAEPSHKYPALVNRATCLAFIDAAISKIDEYT